MRYLIFVLFCCLSQHVVAQHLFVPPSFNTSVNESAVGFSEIPHACYLFMGQRDNPDSSGFVFTTDINGNVQQAKFLYAANSSIVFKKATTNPDQTISLYGEQYKYADSTSYIFYARIDTLLHILDTKTYIIDNSIRKRTTFSSKHTQIGNSVYSIYEYYEQDTNTHFHFKAKLVKWNLLGDTLSTNSMDSCFWSGTVTLGPYRMISSLCPSADSVGLLACVRTSTDIRICWIDTNLRLVDTLTSFRLARPDPRGLSDTILYESSPYFSPCALELNKGNVVVAGHFMDYNTFTINSGIEKYNNTTPPVYKYSIYHPPYANVNSNSRSPHSLIQQQAYLYTAININGTTNVYCETIAVAKYDTSGHRLWLSCFGDTTTNKNSTISNGMFACSDGGLIILGSSTNSISGTDFYIFKLDAATGYPTSIVNVSEQLRSGIVVYPNPATTELNVKGATSGSKAVLYDMTGKEIYNAELAPTNYSVPIASLPTGNYLYKIIDKNGLQLSSGMWVRQ
jgi:hypothetical protein